MFDAVTTYAWNAASSAAQYSLHSLVIWGLLTALLWVLL